ncbi:uncharacterized protein VTP21DRAFT_2239 [Calcarisporiella thermophila]|uniref:uncharacterized protein n=1 Tax=Calcarisporiella thermophila TaxID=911321 RepID=UPI003742BAB4
MPRQPFYFVIVLKLEADAVPLLETLGIAGLEHRVEEGRDWKMVFVGCGGERLRKEMLRERINDYLCGTRLIEEVRVDDLTEADKLRLVYRIITAPPQEQGAGIVPGKEGVESIMAFHDPELSRKWLKHCATKKYFHGDDLKMIKDHFGEKLALYFDFLQCYTLSLSLPAFLGVLAYAFSFEYTIVFSVFLVVWSLVFIELWSRREQVLAIRWRVRRCESIEKRRAAFKEGKYANWLRWKKRCYTLPALALSAALVGTGVSMVYLVQIFLTEYYTGPLKEVTAFMPAIVYASTVPTMTRYYMRWARHFNDLENYETESEYDYHLTKKIFTTKVLTSYFSLLLCAWVYIPCTNYITRLFSHIPLRTQRPSLGTSRLRSQLVFSVLTGPIIHVLTEFVQHIASSGFKATIRQWQGVEQLKEELGEGEEGVTENERDFVRRVEREIGLREWDLNEEYTEITAQFGYVVLFSTVWPLTPLCAFLHNWSKLRSVSLLLCSGARRPIPQRVDTIGPWLENLGVLSWFSSTVNASLVALFNPKHRSQMSVTGLVISILGAEYAYYVARALLRATHAIPQEAQIAMRREEYKLRQGALDRWQTTVSDKVQGLGNQMFSTNTDFWRGEDGEVLVKNVFKRE